MNSRKTLYFVGLQLLCLSVLTATAGTDKPSASPAPGSAARVSTSDGIQARVPGETLAEHQALKECSLSKGPQKGSEGTGEKKILFEQEQPTGVQLWDGSATPDAGSCGTIPHGDVKRDMTSPLPPSLTLVADHSCYSVGQNVTVEIWMNDIEESIVAGQFFLHYDESKLQLISADPSGDPDGPFDPNNPFDTEVYECSMVAGAELPHCTQAPGLIDYAVGTRDQSPPFPGINGTVRMAVLTFTALQQVCDETDLITWRPHSPPTLLGSFDGEPVTPATINLSVADHVPPVLAGCPNDATVECDAVPPPAVPTATDNCDPAPQIAYHEVRTDGNCTDNYALTRTWTATDRCGNSSNCSQSITVRDTISPVLVGCPSSVTVECDAVPPPAAPTATDNCDPAPQIAYNEVLADGSCADDYVLTRTWTATDRCGNSSNCSQSITLHDTKPPQLSDCPGNQNVIPPAGSCEAEVTWTPPTVNDNCDPAPAVVYDIDLDDNSTIDETVAVPGYTFPGGVHRIIVRVTDRCGNVNDDCSFLVTVAATNQILVDVHMRGNSFSVPFTRCITFHLYNCTTLAMTPVQAVVTFDTFTPGIGAQANGIVLDVPCGVYDCIRARDPKHTLWQTDTDFHISGSQYVASFTRKGTEPGQDDRLINGNLNGDDWIEILDYALYAARSGTAVPRNTNCSTTGIHADFSGDGLVDTLDFSFVQTYFMFGDEAECCGLALALTQPRTSISVAELDALGLHDLAVSDLNGDGWVDTTDVALFADGQRPHSGPVELGHDDISPTRGTMPVAPHGRSSTGPRRR